MSQSLPRISIVTPCYNAAAYIEATIHSVINQEYPNLEYILVDGGSNDDTLSIIRRHSHGITRLISEPDRGQADALNKGFKLATGEILGWLCSDDQLFKNSLQLLARKYRPGQSDWWTGAATMISHNDSGITYTDYPTYPPYRRITYAELLIFKPLLPQVSTFWSKPLWQASGGYIRDCYYAMDYDLWLRFARQKPATVLHEHIGLLRQHAAAKTGDPQGFSAYRDEMETIRAEHFASMPIALAKLWVQWSGRIHSLRGGDWKAFLGNRGLKHHYPRWR